MSYHGSGIPEQEYDKMRGFLFGDILMETGMEKEKEKNIIMMEN